MEQTRLGNYAGNTTVNILDIEILRNGLQLCRQLDRVQADWYGEPPELQHIKSIAELRGEIFGSLRESFLNGL